MKHKLFARSYIVALMTVLAVSACGKNMHVAVNGAAGTSQDKTPGVIDTGSGKAEGNTKDATSKLDSTDPVAKKSAEQALYDGQLYPYSTFDLSELSSKRPFLNASDAKNAIREIDEPSFIDKEIHVGFTKGSNLVFRAIKHLPPKESIAEIAEFSLEFAGIRVFVANGSALKTADLSGQILCIADGSKPCSGQSPADDEGKKNLNPAFFDQDGQIINDEFSKIVMDTKVLDYGKDGAVFEPSQQPIKVDLKKLFGLENLSQAELVNWIYAHSAEYAENGYRKFRFVMGNDVFLNGGILNIEVINKTGVKPDQQSAGALKNGATDGQFPKASDADTTGAQTSAGNTVDTGGVTDAKTDEKTVEKTEEKTSEQPAQKTEEAPAAETVKAEQAAKQDEVVVAPVTTSAPAATEVKTEAASVVIVQTTANAQATQTVKTDTVSDDQADESMVSSSAPIVVVQKTAAGEPEVLLKLDPAHLNFEVNKTRIDAAGEKKLVATAALLKKLNSSIAKISVTGHSDKTGKVAYNLDLSKRRAYAVATKLSRAGVEKAKMWDLVKGMGEPKVSSCHPKQPCAKDRRVDIGMTPVKTLSVKEKNTLIKALQDGLNQIWKK